MDEIGSQIIRTIQQEFSDLTDVVQFTRVTLRLTIAVLLGALIGYERERSDKAAGLRTHMLVALGSAIFVLVPQQAGVQLDGISRVLQGVIAGIGFLGAGAVLKITGQVENGEREPGQIRGLTTAASIWATSAIGITVGLGRETTAIISTVMVLIILSVLLRVEKRMERHRNAADQARS